MPSDQDDSRYQQVSTSVDAADTASTLARRAVEGRLAACAQVIGPIASTYRWQGAIETATEWLVLFKTTGDRCAALIEQVRAGHPYQVPEIIAVPITGGHRSYLDWITAETCP